MHEEVKIQLWYSVDQKTNSSQAETHNKRLDIFREHVQTQ